MAKRWCTMADLHGLSRRRVVEANEWLDAFDEADANARRKAEQNTKRR